MAGTMKEPNDIPNNPIMNWGNKQFSGEVNNISIYNNISLYNDKLENPMVSQTTQ